MLVRACRLLVALVLTTPLVLGQGRVWFVDDGDGTGDFSNLQTALDVSAEDDVIMLKKGNHGHFETNYVIDGRSATMTVESIGSVFFEGATLLVKNLSSHQRVIVRGLENLQVGLFDNQGLVRFEQASLGGRENGAPALLCRNNRAVTLSQSTVYGISGQFPSNVTSEGLVSINSHITCYQTFFRGGDGSFDYGRPSLRGGDAVVLEGGSFFLAGGRLEGGNGELGDDSNPDCAFTGGGDGGHGLVMAEGSPQVILRDVLIEPGQGGSSSDPTLCDDGADGMEIDIQTGSLTRSTESADYLFVPDRVREGQLATIDVRSTTGDFVFLAVSLTPGAAPALDPTGSWMIGFPVAALIPLGEAELGWAHTQVEIPELGPGIIGLPVFIQSIHVPPGDVPYFDSFGTMLVLDRGRL